MAATCLQVSSRGDAEPAAPGLNTAGLHYPARLEAPLLIQGRNLPRGGKGAGPEARTPGAMRVLCSLPGPFLATTPHAGDHWPLLQIRTLWGSGSPS